MTYTDTERETLAAALAIVQERGMVTTAIRLRSELADDGVLAHGERVRIDPAAVPTAHNGSVGTAVRDNKNGGYAVVADYGLAVEVAEKWLTRLPFFFPGDRVTATDHGRIIDGNIVVTDETGYAGLRGEVVEGESLGNYEVRADDGREHTIYAGHLRLADKEA